MRLVHLLRKPYTLLHKRLDTRLSLWVLFAVAILFVATLIVVSRFSHQAIEKESLAKAQETLDGTAQRIENMLHKVEVATANMRWNVEHHLDDPNAMALYTQEIVKNNPDILACAIAFEPNYYKERGELFMTYSYRSDQEGGSIVTTQNPKEIEPRLYSSLPYPAHNWYFIPKQENTICWVRPHVPTETILSTIVTCCMPIHDKEGKPVGVLASDISVDWLSSTILSTKPYPHSYCAMLGVQGTYLIHPDSTRLYRTLVHDVVKDSPDPRVKDLVKSMLAGESGCRAVHLFDQDSYVLYQSINNGHWSACIVCPESDIFNANAQLQSSMGVIAVVGLLFIFCFCMFFVKRQLKPLHMLAKSAQRIAEGDFALTIPPTSRKDEIGALQNNFSAMQQALSKHIQQIQQIAKVLKERNETLIAISAQVQGAEHMKTGIIHKIADKMIPPSIAIDGAISELKAKHPNLQQKEIRPLSERVMTNVTIISDLLDEMAKIS